jgi:hypothetical protein
VHAAQAHPNLHVVLEVAEVRGITCEEIEAHRRRHEDPAAAIQPLLSTVGSMSSAADEPHSTSRPNHPHRRSAVFVRALGHPVP